MEYATFLGGVTFGQGSGLAIAIDNAGNAYVTGAVAGTSFPTTSGAFQSALSGASQDAFVTKLAPAGNALVYSTLLGGTGTDTGTGIAVDGAGDAYVVGTTNSTNFPTANAYQSSVSGFSSNHMFVTKLNPSGSSLAYSTYLAGSSSEQGSGIAVDAAGDAFVTGWTVLCKNSGNRKPQPSHRWLPAELGIVVSPRRAVNGPGR